MSTRQTSASDIETLMERLGHSADRHGSALEQLERSLGDELAFDRLWLIWAVLRGELPIDDDVITFRRNIRLNGADQALRDVARRADGNVFGPSSTVEIVSDAVLVDVSHTASTDYTSGIQRVVRETVGRWGASHSILLVAWTENGKALRRLDSIEEKRIRGGAKEESRSETPDFEFSRVIVPHGGLLINPELALDAQRAPRLLALARFSDVKTAYIGYDCVPLTSGETASDGVAREFPLYLDAMGDADRLAAISASTELEFRAWKRMLAASGRTGPDVRTFFLGGDSEHPSDAVIESTAEELLVSEAEPLILVVGSHEPRKNHLSVLQAARLLWEQGERFRLVFIGSGSWRSESFFQLADVLQARGFPLVTKTGASDEFLSASYRLAAVSIFTSFHEGFGLPIVESLRSGTPVITSNLGSMLEVAAEYGGVITVDPHSDEELEEVLRRVLHEPSLLADKRRELESNDYRSWDDYAAEVWDYFVEGSDTPPSD